MNNVALLVVILCLETFSPHESQNRFPDPPNDPTRVYYLSDRKLFPLPFEPGAVLVNVFIPAPESKVTTVQLKGQTAETVLNNDDLRFFVFVGDRMDPPPHQDMATFRVK